jgi:ATP-dependent RNA helicase DeaD
MTFKDFNFKEKLQTAIKEAGFVEPSPIQKDAMPIVLNGKDMVGQAHTGTGKTAAFGLPILNMIENNRGIQAIVIVPTRELAMQVSDELYKFGKFLNLNTVTVYGGQSYSRQLKHIETASIMVATPGRLIDLLKSKKINVKPSFVVLDEADEMLDMGFLDDIKEIFTYLPKQRQTLLFSATMPEAIKKLAKSILQEPEFVTITQKEVTNSLIKQTFYVVDEYERDDALIRLFDYKNPDKSIVFCRTKKEVDRLSTLLVSRGFFAKGLHGDMEQKQREEVITAFRKDVLEVLIATDVAARGLDVNNVSYVFNYHLPFDSESYVHRIGRTGRAGKEGTAVSVVTPHEFRMLQKIQEKTGGKLESKVIPNIKKVKEKKVSNLMEKIKGQEVDNLALDLVEELKEEFDISTIAFKLASLLSKEITVQGSNYIGKSQNDITKLMQRSSSSRDGKRGDSRRNSRGPRNSRGNRGDRNPRGSRRGRSSGGHNKSRRD